MITRFFISCFLSTTIAVPKITVYYRKKQQSIYYGNVVHRTNILKELQEIFGNAQFKTAQQQTITSDAQLVALKDNDYIYADEE